MIDKKILKELGKVNVQFLRNFKFIEKEYTGKILIELNINQGGLTDIKIRPEFRSG